MFPYCFPVSMDVSKIVLNRGLRQAVLAAAAAQGLSMSEIACSLAFKAIASPTILPVNDHQLHGAVKRLPWTNQAPAASEQRRWRELVQVKGGLHGLAGVAGTALLDRPGLEGQRHDGECGRADQAFDVCVRRAR
jgi:hypothetical protein